MFSPTAQLAVLFNWLTPLRPPAHLRSVSFTACLQQRRQDLRRQRPGQRSPAPPPTRAVRHHGRWWRHRRSGPEEFVWLGGSDSTDLSRFTKESSVGEISSVPARESRWTLKGVFPLATTLLGPLGLGSARYDSTRLRFHHDLVTSSVWVELSQQGGPKLPWHLFCLQCPRFIGFYVLRWLRFYFCIF